MVRGVSNICQDGSRLTYCGLLSRGSVAESVAERDAVGKRSLGCPPRLNSATSCSLPGSGGVRRSALPNRVKVIFIAASGAGADVGGVGGGGRTNELYFYRSEGSRLAFNGGPLRPLRGEAPGRLSTDERRRRGTRRPSVGESTRRREGPSRNPWQTRRPTPFSQGRPPRSASAALSVSTDGKASAGRPGRRPRLGDASAATCRRSAAWSSGGGRSRQGRSRGHSRPRPVAAASPTSPGFRGVSCLRISAADRVNFTFTGVNRRRFRCANCSLSLSH